MQKYNEKKEVFIKCLQKRIKSWYETTTPVPWKKTCRWKSTDLFVGSSLVLTDSKAKRNPIGIDEECKLQYNEILNHNKLKAEKRIILEGEPGSGKTMMSSQLAYDWSQGKISEVDVLIFLPLKFVNNKTLIQAVKRFYFSAYDSISVKDIKSFLTNEDLQSCLILDGFEEYNSAEMTPPGEPSEVTKVMEKSKFPNCKVILTSRSDYAKDLPTCPMLKIGRFGEKERHTYIEKVFADDTEKQQEIQSAIENNPFLLDLCSTPLLFVLAVHNIESTVALQEAQLDRVAPFMESMVKKLCTLPDSKSEGSVPDSDGVSDESQLEKFAYNGLCKGQQILLWQKDVLEASITNLKKFLDSGILVVEEGIVKGNLRIIQDEKTQDEFSQDKKKTKKTKIETTVDDQMNQNAKAGTGEMASAFHRGYSAIEGLNENVTTISGRPVSYATQEHISSTNRFWKQFTPKTFTEKRVLHSEGTTNKTGSSVRTQKLASYGKVQADSDPAREYSVTLPPASGAVELKPGLQSEPDLSEFQKTSNSSTAKDFPLEVKFLHKVMQEWFASKHLSSLLWKSLDDNSLHNLLYEVLPQISPIDLHYILRFTSYLCPPSCYLIMDFLYRDHCMVNGAISEDIMNIACLCFAECMQGNVSQITSVDKAIVKESMNLVVANMCRDVMIITSDDSRISQQSKIALLKHAANNGNLMKELHLVDVVKEVDESSTKLTSGVRFDVFNMIEVLEMSRWDPHSEEEDCQSIIKIVLCSHSIKKARLHFPHQPPIIEKEALGDLVIYDKKVEWIIGTKCIQTLNMETFKWEMIVESDCDYPPSKQRGVTHVAAYVKYDRAAKDNEDLTINDGDIITDLIFKYYGWLEGKLNGKRGTFPCNFVKIITLNSSTPAAKTRASNSQISLGAITTDENASKKTKLWAKVIASYESQDDDELSLEEKQQIEVTNQSQQWWWEGILKGKRGMFPSNYVILLPESDETEQHDNDAPDENASKKTKLRAKVVDSYESQDDDELSLEEKQQTEVTNQSQQRWWEGILKGKRGMFQSTYEILLPESDEVEQHDNDAPVGAQVMYDYEAFGPHELTVKVGDIITDISVVGKGWWKGVVKGKRGNFPSNCVKIWTEVRVKYNYEAAEPDKLTIKVGDIITDVSVPVDRWWEGELNGRRGMFPSNFVDVGKDVRVWYSYDAVRPEELTIKVGDLITNVSAIANGWWEGELDGRRGMFPSSFVEVCKDVRVRYSYDAVRPEELTIKVSDLITNVSVIADGWWEGELNGRRGMFPSNFVELCKGTSQQSSQKKTDQDKLTPSYTLHSDSELSLVEGNIIDITNRVDLWWWKGIVKGRKGHIPLYCLVLLRKDEKGEDAQQDYAKPVGAQVMYDYEAFGPHELTVKVGDIITDISVVGKGWWKGVVNGKRGNFPSNCVKIWTEVRVKYNYEAAEPDKLTIKVGDIITDVSVPVDRWWEGELNGRRGMFPSNFVEVGKDVRVWYSYDAVRPEELTIKVGDLITNVSAIANGWWEGELDGRRGMFPSSFVEVCKDVRVRYSYDANRPEELTIKVSDLITNVSVIADGWWEGELNGRRGMFPSNFVELCKGTSQQPSRKKTDQDKPTPSYTSHSDSELSLVEGNIIDITNRVDLWWWKGILKGRKGHIPLYCLVLLQKDEKGEEDAQQDYAKPVGGNVEDVTDLHKNQFIDERGGTLFLRKADISLHVPAGALKVGCMLHVTVPMDPSLFFYGHEVLPRNTPLIICEPDNLHFQVPVKLTLPHCAVLKNPGNHTVEVKFGNKASKISKEMTWLSENVEYSLGERYCSVYLNHFSGVDSSIPSDEKILRVIPFIKLGQRNRHILNVWLCNDLESNFQSVLQTEEKNGGVPLDSYDTFRLRCASGPGDTLNVHLEVLEGSSWQPDKPEARTVNVTRMLMSNKTKCNFWLISNGADDESYMYFQLRVTQTVEGEKTETTFALRKRICDLKMPVKFSNLFSWNKQMGHLFSTDTKASERPYTAVVYMDPVKHVNDDIITTLWLWPFDSTTEIFKCLQEEQELQYRHQVDSENSFAVVVEKPDIVTKAQFLNGPWLLSPEEMKIETDRIRFGSRAKFQFIGKRDKSNQDEYIELQMDTFQVEKETITFMAEVELNTLFYGKRRRETDKLRASTNEEYSQLPSEDHSKKPCQPQAKSLPSTSSAVVNKEPSQSNHGVSGNIQPRGTEVNTKTKEELIHDCFMFVKENFVRGWENLGRELKLKDSDIDRLIVDHPGNVKEQIYKMLLLWEQKHGTSATPERLIDALIQIENKKLAEDLAAMVKESL